MAKTYTVRLVRYDNWEVVADDYREACKKAAVCFKELNYPEDAPEGHITHSDYDLDVEEVQSCPSLF